MEDLEIENIFVRQGNYGRPLSKTGTHADICRMTGIAGGRKREENIPKGKT